MGKTRDLFKKIRDTKGTFLAKMGSIKDRNGMDLKEAEDTKKRWQEYTELSKLPSKLLKSIDKLQPPCFCFPGPSKFLNHYIKKIFTTQIITMV